MTTTAASAQAPVELPLWPGGCPTDNGLGGEETIPGEGLVANISRPSLLVYPAQRPNGAAIVMCPGGRYAYLAIDHEGRDLAPWLNALGFTYAVLKYRLPGGGHSEVPLDDAGQAMRLVRAHAAKWKLDPAKVGIMGASAGGHVAASLANLYGDRDVRPDFHILLYPVISMKEGKAHAGSRQNLLGEHPADRLVERYSLEGRVGRHTPPAFIALSADDRSVAPRRNGIDYALALLQQGVRASLHVYPTGGHGWGFRDSFAYKRQWTAELEQWLRQEVLDR